MKERIFVSRRIPDPGLDLLRENFSGLEVFPEDRPVSREELLAAVHQCDGLLCLLTDTIDREVLQAAAGIKIIANYAVGYNNIDVAEATRRKIMVTNTPGVLTDATADFTWALIFAAVRRVSEGERFTRAGRFNGWGPLLLLGGEIAGRTLGIMGAGRIGFAVAKRAAGFRMKILYYDRTRNQELEQNFNAEYVPMAELLTRSDIVTLHVPLTAQTRHLLGESELKMMKNSAYLINTSRGLVVDEKALAVALRRGELAGAALDVYENEPEIEAGLLDLENVVLTPHTASATHESRTRMALMAAGNLIAGFKGERPPNLVNPEVLE